VLNLPTVSDSAQFAVLEHRLPERIGLSLDEIRRRRNDRLEKGTDWERIGRWIKYSQSGIQKLQQELGVPEINPPPKPAEWLDVEVWRCNFPNPRIIECKEFTTGRLWHVRIHPEWRDRYKPRMKIKILANGERIATTRRPRERYKY